LSFPYVGKARENVHDNLIMFTQVADVKKLRHVPTAIVEFCGFE
jgi:hypothetical protein